MPRFTSAMAAFTNAIAFPRCPPLLCSALCNSDFAASRSARASDMRVSSGPREAAETKAVEARMTTSTTQKLFLIETLLRFVLMKDRRGILTLIKRGHPTLLNEKATRKEPHAAQCRESFIGWSCAAVW